MQGHQFLHDLRVLPMGGSDMVLGVDWMKKYSPLVMDFNEMSVAFKKEGEQIILKGRQQQTSLKLISGEKLQKLMGKDPEMLGELYMINVDYEGTETPLALQTLLTEYQDIF